METIEQLKDLKGHCKAMQDIDRCKDYTPYITAINVAIQKLKQDKKCEFCCNVCHMRGDVVRTFYVNSSYSTKFKQFCYCPMCGRKL